MWPAGQHLELPHSTHTSGHPEGCLTVGARSNPARSNPIPEGPEPSPAQYQQGWSLPSAKTCSCPYRRGGAGLPNALLGSVPAKQWQRPGGQSGARWHGERVQDVALRSNPTPALLQGQHTCRPAPSLPRAALPSAPASLTPAHGLDATMLHQHSRLWHKALCSSIQPSRGDFPNMPQDLRLSAL